MRLSIIATFVAAVSLSVAATSAEAQSRVRAGGLSCKLSPTVGLIIGSRQQIQCTFTPSTGGRVEYYSGHIGRLGLDLGVTGGGRMIWGVFARTTKLPPRTLAGAGVSDVADLSAGLDGLPPTDGVRILTADATRVIVRPSGTEPKVKCYLEVVVPVAPDASHDDLTAARAFARERLDRVKADMGRALGL